MKKISFNLIIKILISLFITIIWLMFFWGLSILFASEENKNNRKFNSYQLEIGKDQAIISKYIKVIRPTMPKILRNGMAYEIAKQSKQNGLPWQLITAIIKVESYFDPMAVSIVGAKGLMQVYSLVCRGIIIDESKLFNIQYNIFCGICIFQEKLEVARGNYERAIVLYCGKGPEARQYGKKVLKTISEIIAFDVAYNNLKII